MDAVCYGFNNFGQINSNKFNSVLSQFKLNKLEECIKCIAFGWSRSYVVLENGTVFLQGFFDSQLGNRKQLEVPFQSIVKKVTCLKRYDIFLTEDGSCWKYNLKGEWIKLDHLIPNELKKPDFKIIDIDSSTDLHICVSNEGLLLSFPSHIDLPLPSKVKKACCGLEHFICLLDNGSVFVWGAGSRGQIGNGSLSTVEQPELLVPLDGLIVVDIDAGGWHSAATTVDGDLYMWGWNNFGQLGIHCEESSNEGDMDNCISVVSEPKVISCFDESDVSFKQVSCGTGHTLVLLDDGSVWGCGNNKYGQINPISAEKCFHRMIRVPLPEKIDSVKRILCMSWNSVIFITCKE